MGVTPAFQALLNYQPDRGEFLTEDHYQRDLRVCILGADVARTLFPIEDPLGKQGVKVRDYGDLEVWSKALQDGSRAVVLFNRSDREVNIGVLWTDIGYPEHLKAKVRDLWQKKNLGSSSGAYSADVPSHGVVMLKIMP